METLLLFLLVPLIGYTISLGNKVGKLTKEVEALRQGSAPRATTASAPAAATQTAMPQSPTMTPAAAPAVSFASASQTPEAHPLDKFFEWLQEDILMKLGALLLLIGFGWFVSYAFANNWIGPAGRIALGLSVGALILAAGGWRIRTLIHQGSVLLVLGSSTVLLTVFAARHIYDFFTPGLALLIMFLSVSFVAFASVRYERFALAFAGLILAAVAPLFTSAPTPDVVGLFSYILIVVLGTLWVVYLRGWLALPLTALIIVFFYGLPFMYGLSPREEDIALFFSFIFTAIFFGANIVSIIYRKLEAPKPVHVVTALATGLYLILWITFAAAPEWHSLLYVAWMLVFSVGAFLVYQHTTNRAPFYIYGGTSIALLAAATAAELDGQILTIAYIVEVSVLVAVGYRLTKSLVVGEKLSWLFLGPMLLSVPSLTSSAWNTGFIHDDFFVLFILMMALAGTAVFFYQKKQAGEATESNVDVVLAFTAALYGLALIWLIAHSVFVPDTATMAALIIYTIIGLTMYTKGKLHENKTIWISGGFLLGVVIARLLLVEVWQMEPTGQIITFCVIGTLLVLTAFSGRKPKTQQPVAADPNQIA